MDKYDFSGWATKYNKKCSDGRTIRPGAFDDLDGKKVPLVWMHQHDSPTNVVGNALLHCYQEGVRADCSFNNNELANDAKEAVRHGDVTSLSIYANQLKQQGGDVLHGVIREVSLVLAGANPDAVIDYPVIQHGDGTSEEDFTEAIIWSGEEIEDMAKKSYFEHADKEEPKEEKKESEDKGKTVKDVFDTLNEEQKKVVYFLIGQAVEDAKNEEDDDEEDDEEVEHSGMYEGEDMKHNVFDNSMDEESDVLSQSAMDTIFKDAKRLGSLRDSVLEHAEDYGIDGVEWLFPEAHNLNEVPEFIKRDTGWVSAVMSGVKHSPFSRVKTQFADIREDEARAKGYIKGNQKKEEVFTLLKRSTTPQTIYKKQKLDRDDVVDITDFDVVAWIKGEMRMMLDEEIARAILIGDGRAASSDDKISEDHIRPIANDADLFTIKYAITQDSNATASDNAQAIIDGAIRARKNYKGSGNPTLFTTEDVLTEMLLIKDGIGHPMYKSESELCTTLRVSRIITVEPMEGFKVSNKDVLGIIVNLADYCVGADKGGAINMFDDFDIDVNQMKYLIETRCSGALVKPYSAIVLFKNEAPSSVTGGVSSSKTTYVETSIPSGGNPKTLGLYEYNSTTGKYVLTNDTSDAGGGKKYYTRVSFNAE